MADNTILNAGSAGDTIRDLARQAGTIKTQVVQLDLGGATANAEVLITAGQQAMAASVPVVLASNQTAIPVSGAVPVNTTTIGTFTAADAVGPAPDGTGTLINAASTAGSIISLQAPDGFQAWTSMMTGWANGTVYSEASTDSTNGTDGNWVDIKGRRTGTTPGIESVVYAQVANGYYRGNLAGFKWFRLRFVGGTTFPTVRIYLSNGQGATFLNSGIPQGSSVIGSTVARGAAKGTAVAADVTSNPVDANTQALHVNLAGTNAVNATLTAETTKVIGTVNIAAAQTLATVTTVSAVTAITNALPTGANSIGTVQAPAITKGTQGTTGFTTQDIKDAGRNQVHFYMVIPVLTSATDTLQSLTVTKSGATVTATTTPAVVTTGKTLRITRLAASYIATATSGYGIVRLRFNTAGVVAITSPVAAMLTVGAGTANAANSLGSEEATIEEGWEFAAGTGIGVSAQGFAAATATAVGYVIVSGTGYEY